MKRSLRFAVLWAMAAVLLGPALSSAHPHLQVDQQAQLTIGLGRAQLTVSIVPSVDDGPAIFDHIDRDADGAVSNVEASAFGAEILASTSFTVDGVPVRFGEPTVALPSRQVAAQGAGVLEVSAHASYSLAKGSSHIATFDIDFPVFAKTWFVQPFFFDELVTATTSRAVERGDGTGRVTISFQIREHG